MKYPPSIALLGPKGYFRSCYHGCNLLGDPDPDPTPQEDLLHTIISPVLQLLALW